MDNQEYAKFIEEIRETCMKYKEHLITAEQCNAEMKKTMAPLSNEELLIAYYTINNL